ncbi:(S)-2-haloacid dehalogenase 4A [Parachaetomium inaequale]|uniref:(S)-2-haloacid dehalogenase 4A n=1 Tax=Parachaetomium inaequale TaxID=2588326 RepID=A0AAN6PA61_9PEZI|nr:(S)-2-haloacid dehalogenase 4A [Parachaetomium inaequale]
MPSPPPLAEAPDTAIQALTFDLFGTAVDWRTSITTALTKAATTKLTSPSFALLPPATQSRLQSLTPKDWSLFASSWRAAYSTFTRTFVPGTTPWQTVDALHRASLASLLSDWGLADVYSPAELDALSNAWHFLDPWPDVVEGMRRLNSSSRRRFVTASLSNGNTALLADLDAHARLGLGRLISAEDFEMYKPRGEVYRGACAMLGLEPARVALVAAHLRDLAGARACGMRTVYVERPGEEEWAVDEERYAQAREWVDVWVAEGEGGFKEVARRLGV